MKIETKLHTVFILVGPSMCGKSTFARQFQLALDEQLHKVGVPGVVKVISSDAERQSLYSHGSLHRYSGLMSEASEAAFKVLMAKFEAAIMFPINSEFVIIDTTGMNDQFRKEVKKIADKHEYRTELVTFEYTNKSYASESTPAEKLVVDSSAARFKQKVLPNLGRKEHDGNIRIRERDPNHWFGIEVEIEDLDIYAKSHLYLPLHEELVVIGDIHEHVTAFQTLDMQLMKSRDSNATSPKEVLVGDYLDKGGNTEDTIIVIENFVEQGGIIVHGNHESYAVKRIKGEIKNPDLELEAKYMSSLKVLLKDPGLAARVVNLFDNHSVPFLKVIGRDVRTVYVTHAPCENKYLGKMSSDALKAQRNLFGRRDKDYREAYKFIFEEAVGNHPLHVFGHVAHNANKLEFRNKIFLDTGAVYGGKLTAFVYKNNRYGFYEVKTESLVEHQKELQSNLTVPINAPERPFSIYDYKLSPDDMKFLNRTLKNGIKYISGTMAPAPSTDTQIESLEAGLDYFNSRGVQFVVIEPKFMGSRCQAYLYKKDPSKSFLVSRNGFKIRMTEQLQTMLDNIPKQLDDLGFEWEDELILDGELEPWTTLGRGLVEEQFKAYEGLVHYELSTLAQDEEFNNLDFKQKIDAQGLLENDLKTFSDTLDIYAQDGEPFYSPFAILKCDGKVTNTQIELAQSFFSVSTYDALTIDVTDPEEIQLAKEFFEKVTVEKNMEGVVIKPLTLNDEIAPYMKVRNENYLTLVYGYDYKRRYEALCKQKRIGGKLKVSIREHELAMKMLSADNGPAVTELVVKMISQLSKEKELDPRL